MAVQLVSLFAFGLVVTFVVLLGVLRAKEFKEKEMRSRTAGREDAVEVAPAPRLVVSKPVA